MKLIRSALVIAAIASAFSLACGQTNSWSNRIKSKTKHPLASIFSSCPNYINVLSIDGRRFENARGIKWFYLPVPRTDTICFVIDERGGAVTYHLFDMDTDNDVAIHAQSSYFGRSIGATNTSDSIETGTNGDIMLCNIDRDAKSTVPDLANLATVKWTCVLNIPSRRVVSQNIFYYDRKGKLILENSSSPLPSK